MRRSRLRTLAATGPFCLIEAIVGLARLIASDGAAVRGLEWLYVVSEHPSMPDEVRGKCAALRADLVARLAPATVQSVERRAGGRDIVSIVEELLSMGDAGFG